MFVLTLFFNYLTLLWELTQLKENIMLCIKEAARLFSQSFVHPCFKEKEIYAEVKSSLDNINEQINLLKEEIAAIKLEHITKKEFNYKPNKNVTPPRYQVVSEGYDTNF